MNNKPAVTRRIEIYNPQQAAQADLGPLFDVIEILHRLGEEVKKQHAFNDEPQQADHEQQP